MLNPKQKAELSARPLGYNYAEELKQRFGASAHLLRMDAMGNGEKRRPYTLAEGVAVIDISGVLVNSAFWWDETEYEDIRAEVAFALNDVEVKGILLRVNSPGGETDGAFETAAFLAQAGKKKPVWAVADPMAYSAAYLMASQAAKVYAAPISGGVGSVGVFCLHLDFSEMLKQEGIKPTLISAGEGKTACNRFEPLSDEGREKLQGEVDRLYGEFVGAVARGRKMPKEAVRTLGAWTYCGSKAALSSGLADVSGLCEQAWMDLALAVQAKAIQPGFPGVTNSATTADAATASADDRDSTKEVPMSTENAADANKPPAEQKFTQADIDAAVATAMAKAKVEAAAREIEGKKDEAAADAKEVVALCTMAGKDSLALDFIKKSATVSQVREALMKAAVAESGEEISNHVKQGAKEPEPAGVITAGMIVAECAKIGAQMTAQMGGK